MRNVGPGSLSNPLVGKLAGSGCFCGRVAVWPSSAALVITTRKAFFVPIGEAAFQQTVTRGCLHGRGLYPPTEYDNVPSNFGRCIVKRASRFSRFAVFSLITFVTGLYGQVDRANINGTV